MLSKKSKFAGTAVKVEGTRPSPSFSLVPLHQ